MAYETDNRGLSVRPGDGDHDPWLNPKESGGEEGEAAARIGITDEGDALRGPSVGRRRQCRSLGGQNGDRAATQRIGDEGAPVVARTRQRGEEESGLDSAGIAGQPNDVNVNGARCIALCQVVVQQIS